METIGCQGQANHLSRQIDESDGFTFLAGPASAVSCPGSYRNSRLLFFDELHIHDSGDARLLTRLLYHVFTRKLTVLATSNYAPDNLLPNPVWHHIFEPA
jgi:predicted ATPase